MPAGEQEHAVGPERAIRTRKPNVEVTDPGGDVGREDHIELASLEIVGQAQQIGEHKAAGQTERCCGASSGGELAG